MFINVGAICSFGEEKGQGTATFTLQAPTRLTNYPEELTTLTSPDPVKLYLTSSYLT